MIIRSRPTLAMDRRRIDADGALHVERSNISKANVCPYRGREIPDWQSLGLDGDRTYRLLRHPDELAKAAETFNHKPVLNIHVPVTADDYPKHAIVGTTGSHCAFDGQFLTNSMTVWEGRARRGIENNRKRELSCGYRYRADMTAGEYEGLPYDGVMRDIVGNHVALVIEGRAGADVLVGDESMKTNSRTALMVSGAIAGLVTPLLAADAKVDISDALKDVTADTIGGKSDEIAGKVVELVKPHLAADQSLDADTVKLAIDAVTPLPMAEDAIVEPKPEPKPESKPKPKDAPVAGLDAAAVDARVADAVAAAEARASAIRSAERDVRPVVGEVSAMDSASAIYKLAFDAMKVDVKDVPEDSYAAFFRALPKGDKPKIAQDAADPSDFAKRFPDAIKLVRS